MAKQVQLRRGTTAELSSVTGAEGEVIVDTTKDTLTLHDAYTAGGIPMLREDLDNIANQSITPAMMSIAGSNPYDALMINAAGTAVEFGSSAGRLLAVNSYTNDAGGYLESVNNMRVGGTWTWTKPAGCKYALVYCTGAGAGSACNDTNYRGWAGGAGATAIGWYDVSGVSTVTVTTGSGSTAANSATTATGQGGASSFGSFCTAYGGYGPMSESPHGGGRGGYSVGGNILNLHGGAGQGVHGADFEGGGGASFWYAGGGQHHNGTSQGDNDHTRRRTSGRFGGGGGVNYGSQYTTSYRAGGAGVVVVYAYS
jgi:hypothetical protein